MRCKLDSTENPRSFEKYPTPPSTLCLDFKGCAETQIPTPPGGPGGPTHTPPHTREDSIFNFGAKFQVYGAKIQIYGDKIHLYGAKTQRCGAKIQIFDPKFKNLNFCTTKNLPLCTRKTPGAAGLTPTHPPIGVSKKLTCPPLA